MGVHNSGSLDCRYVKRGIKDRVLSSPRDKDSRDSHSTPLFTRVRYYRRNRLFVRKVSYRTCSTSRGKSRVLQHDFRSAEEARRSSSDSKSAAVESPGDTSPFQNGNLTNNYEGPKEGGLCSDIRSNRCISSCSDSFRFQKVSKIQIPRSELSISGHAVWPSVITKGVHENNGRRSSIFKEDGYSHIYVSGRLVNDKLGQTQTEGSARLYTEVSSKTRSDDKLQKVQFNSDSESGIFGRKVRLSERSSDSDRDEIRKNFRDYCNSKIESENSGDCDSKTVRSDGIMHLPDSDGTSAYAPYTAIPISVVETKCSSSPSLYSDQGQFDSTPNVVDNSQEHIQRNDFTATYSRSNIDNGCVVTGMGSSYEQLENSRCMAETISYQTHKLVGNESGFSSSSGSDCFCSGKDSISQVRQFNCDQLHKQGGRNSFPGHVLSDMGSVSMVHSEQSSHSSGPYTGQQKFSCGCALQRKVQCTNDRMDSELYGGQFIISRNVNADNRSFCDLSQQKTTSLLFTSSRCRCSSSRCADLRLDRSVCLCVPSTHPTSSSITKDSGGKMCSSVSGPDVAKAILVPSSSRDVNRGTHKTSRTTGSAVSTSKSDFPSRSRNVQSCSMEVVKLKHRSEGFSKRTSDIMANARKASTQTVYDARIRIYDSWCKDQHIDPFKASLPQIAEFFMYLHSVRKCTPKTITGYKSAISLIHNDGSKVTSSSELKALIKGLFNLNPSVRTLTPNWNLPLVLSVLTRHPFEPVSSIDLKFLTFKTVFLMALASASRVSELHSLSLDEGHFRKEHKGIRLLPNMQFLAKTQTMNKTWEPIYIPAFDSYATDSTDLKLCPCRALIAYIEKTKQIRKSNRLFVTYQENNHKEASKDSIARWIVSTVQYAYENADKDTLQTVRAHDTRRLSTSWALFNGASASEILKAAHWASETTFTSFYLRDVPDHQAIFARSAILGSVKRRR